MTQAYRLRSTKSERRQALRKSRRRVQHVHTSWKKLSMLAIVNEKQVELGRVNMIKIGNLYLRRCSFQQRKSTIPACSPFLRKTKSGPFHAGPGGSQRTVDRSSRSQLPDAESFSEMRTRTCGSFGEARLKMGKILRVPTIPHTRFIVGERERVSHIWRPGPNEFSG